MIFYGHGSVWDARKGGRLCRFENGKAEVVDPVDCSYLIKLGYKHDPIDYGDVVVPIDPVNEAPKKRGRKPKAVENGDVDDN